MLRLQQQCPLPDGKIRFGVNSPEILALFKEDVAMRLLQLGQRDPFLSQWPHILTFILANGTVPGRLIWVWIFCSASNADLAHKLPTPFCLDRSEPVASWATQRSCNGARAAIRTSALQSDRDLRRALLGTPTYHADQSENRSRDQQNLGRNDQGDIRGLGVFSEPVKGQRSDCTTAREPRTRERVDVYADFSCAGDFVNKIAKTNNPAPITMALC